MKFGDLLPLPLGEGWGEGFHFAVFRNIIKNPESAPSGRGLG